MGTEYSADIVGIDGSLVKSESFINFDSGNIVSIPLNDLAKGVYTIMITNHSGLISAKRFVKR